MSHIDLTAIGQVITTTILVAGLLVGMVKALNKRNEDRHALTESHLTKQLSETREHLSREITAVKNEVHVIDGDVKANTRAISFLRERTAGLESAVFHRAPVTEDDIDRVTT